MLGNISMPSTDSQSKDFEHQTLMEREDLETSLVVQWLRLCTPNAGGLGLIPVQGNRFPMLQLKILDSTTKFEDSTAEITPDHQAIQLPLCVDALLLLWLLAMALRTTALSGLLIPTKS